MEYPKSAEYIIIGGGIIGISTAYHLAKEKKDIIVLDANELVSQASGRNGGMVVQLDARDANIAVMKAKLGFARLGVKELKNYQKELDVDFEFKQVGCLDFIFDKKELEEMKAFVEIQNSSGDDETVIISKEKTIEEMPIINEKVLGARYRASDGRLNSLKLCFGIIDKAKTMGVRFYEFTRVTEIIIESGQVRGVKLSDGTVIKAKWVINCTNAWAESLTPEIRIVPIREIAMITEPVPEIKQNTYEAYIGSLMGTEEEQHCWGTSQHANGNICIGGPGLLPNHFYNDVTYEETVNTVNMIKAMFPILNEIKIIRAWCGAFAFTPDYNPYVGHITGKKGLFVIAGLNNGFALGPSLSKLGSELLLEGEASLDITTMNPMRFVNKNIVLPKEYKYAGIQKYIAEHSREWLA
jgi:sarcosine oxidase, subunit beta